MVERGRGAICSSCLLLHALDDEETSVEETLGAIGDTVCFPGGELIARFTHTFVPAGVGQLCNDLLNGSFLVLFLDESLHGCRGSGIGVGIHFFLEEGVQKLEERNWRDGMRERRGINGANRN